MLGLYFGRHSPPHYGCGIAYFRGETFITTHGEGFGDGNSLCKGNGTGAGFGVVYTPDNYRIPWSLTC